MKKLCGTIEIDCKTSSLVYKFTCPNCQKEYSMIINNLSNDVFRLELYELESTKTKSELC